MKIGIGVIALLAMASTTTSYAEERKQSGSAKEGAVVIGTAAAGALLGGPVGYLAGALTGVWLAHNIAKADELERSQDDLTGVQKEAVTMSADLSKADRDIAALETELQASHQSIAHYRRLASDYVTFEMLFHTGASDLSSDSEQRLAQLAVFLAEQPEIGVTLSGFADPRGDDDFNLDLSTQRVRSIAEVLEAGGVDPHRISVNAYGDLQSSAIDGDLDAYALERRVSIELSVPEFVPELASITE